MDLLIDTHTLLWIVSDSARLSSKAINLFQNKTNRILLSKASLWELTIKLSLSKLKLRKSLADFIDHDIIANDIHILPIKIDHFLILESLAFHHRDPFDRLIIAQAIHENIPILGCDKIFDKYPVKRVW